MKVLLYLLLLAILSGAQACIGRPRPRPTTTSAAPEPSCECGPGTRNLTWIAGTLEPSSRKQTRIIGGSPAGKKEFPWMIQLMKLSPVTNRFEYHCGGSIISQHVIVTAAHCIPDKNHKNYRVVTEDLQIYEVANIELYKKYDPTTLDYDYGIVQLTKSLTFTESVRPICLPWNDNIANENGDTVVIGYGLTSPPPLGQYSRFLKKVTLLGVENNVCTQRTGYQPTPTHKCLLPEPNNIGSVCDGDSGGPAMKLFDPLNGKPSFYVQTGIISKIYGQPDECIFSLVTRLSGEGLKWINGFRSCN